MHFAKHCRALAGIGLVFVFTAAAFAAPRITSFGTPPAGQYGAGQTTSIAPIWSEPITVTGTPSITVRIGTVDHEFVYYNNGSGEYRYTLQAGDNGSPNIIGPVHLNGGSIKGADGSDAVLTFTPQQDPNVVYDTVPPAAPTLAVAPVSPNSEQPFTLSGTAEAGSTIVFREGSAASATTNASGNWSVTFGPRAAGTYTYGAVAIDRAGNPSALARITFTIQQGTPAAGVPVVTALGLPADGIYGEGTVRNYPHSLSVSVTFSSSVVVTGSPTVGLKIGSKLRQSGPPRNVSFSGSTVTTLVFEYTPAYDEDGILTITGPIMLNGGTIKAPDGRDASISFAAQQTSGVYIDLVPPANPTINGINPASPTTEQSFVISGTAEPNTTVWFWTMNESNLGSGPVDANGNWSVTFAPRAANTYTWYAYTQDRANNRSVSPFSFGGTPVTFTVQPTPTGRPAITTQPTSRTAALGAGVTFTTATSSTNATFQWQYNGAPIAGATSASYTIDRVAPELTGLYAATVTDSGSSTLSSAAILGLSTTDKIVGDAREVGTDIVHPNGNVYDQALPNGRAFTLTANPGQVVRASWVDLSGDIIQAEFSGAGALSVVLDVPSGPAPASDYNQPDVAYMKGHAGLVITGADETTNVSVFSVGRITAVNQSLFRDDVHYDGVADLAFIAIMSANGNFGGIRAGNANFWSTTGYTGIYAPGVRFTGPVYVCEITATENAIPVLMLGSASDTKVTGGDFAQTNGRAVQVSGLTQLRFVAGSDSHGNVIPAQPCRGRLEENGADVTAQIVSP